LCCALSWGMERRGCPFPRGGGVVWDHWSPPASGNLRVSSNTDPPLNADLHIGQSDIRPLIREQLRLLEREIAQALDRGVQDRMTRIHLEDALVRIGKALG
jgi:hypothetical protein